MDFYMNFQGTSAVSKGKKKTRGQATKLADAMQRWVCTHALAPGSNSAWPLHMPQLLGHVYKEWQGQLCMVYDQHEECVHICTGMLFSG
eukprot:1157751-Pelagomonas_calceolata.AAC.11